MKNKGMQLSEIVVAMLILMATIAVPVAVAEANTGTSTGNTQTAGSNCGCQSPNQSQQVVLRNLVTINFDENQKSVLDIQPLPSVNKTCSTPSATNATVVNFNKSSNTITLNVNGKIVDVQWNSEEILNETKIAGDHKQSISFTTVDYRTTLENQSNTHPQHILSYYHDAENFNASVTTKIIVDPETGDHLYYLTVANYKPDKKEVITYGDIISINETVTLSQHYEILSDALTELAKDESDLSRAYKGLRQELRLLSKEVQEKLPQYDKPAKNGAVAIVMDDTCTTVCGLICGAIGVGVCGVICAGNPVCALACAAAWGFACGGTCSWYCTGNVDPCSVGCGTFCPTLCEAMCIALKFGWICETACVPICVGSCELYC